MYPSLRGIKSKSIHMGDMNPYEDSDGEDGVVQGIEPGFDDEDEKDSY